MAMSRRGVLNHIIRIASAPALLVAMTCSPLRPLHAGPSCSRPECARSDWAGGRGRSSFPTRVLPTSVSIRLAPVKAIPTENKEEDLDGASRLAFYFFEITPANLRLFCREIF